MRNPLCESDRAFHLPDFPAIRPEHVIPAIDQLLQEYRQGIEAQLAASGEPDWSMVEKEIDWADALARAWSPVSHLKAVADHAKLRKVYNKALERLTEHENWRQHHRGIYRAYRALRESPS